MRELSVGLNLTAGATTAIYTVPKGCTAIATLLMITNTGGSTNTVSASWYDASNTTSVGILGSKSLGASDYIQLSQGRMVMNEYDELCVTPVAGASMSAIATFEIHQNTTVQHGGN